MTVHHGDCLLVMPTLAESSVDAIVTDPPYGLGFMGKDWDHGVPGAHFWVEALRVAKPGAHLVAFGGTRTFHRLTVGIEDAGWEIRDCLSWLYGSGFPKSHNGTWGGTALKPAWEPIILARKPFKGTVASNVQQHGTGALNVDGCRIAGGERPNIVKHEKNGHFSGVFAQGSHADGTTNSGRWPANVVLDDEAAAILDEQTGELKSGFMAGGTIRNARTSVAMGRMTDNAASRDTFADSGGASRFFYTAKASRSEREAGLEGHEIRPFVQGYAALPESSPDREGDIGLNRVKHVTNHHPTVKPLDLMQWLCRLVTPKGGLILDPFCGSGSTGRAAVAEGFSFVGIELSAEYVEIARARIAEYAPLFGDVA